MNDHLENDDLIERLRAEDPAAKGSDEAPGEREAVRSRVSELLKADSREPKRQVLRPRLVIAAVVVLLAVGLALGLTLGGSSSGPARALAIEKTPKWVTLRLTNPTATDEQMNQELDDAGIDRVRVLSVPEAPKDQPHPYWGHDSVGTWAGYVELGPHCQGGVTRFGYDVDIPISHPYNRANRHGAEDLFDLTLPHHSGALIAEEAGNPFSKSVVRLPTDSIDDPRNAAKILVPVRPRSPSDTSTANDIGTNQLVALGGVFARYGEAIESGQTSCADFGLKRYPKPTFPPSEGRWVVVHVTGSQGGDRKMTRELRSGGIKGEVRQIPAQPTEIGHWLGFSRVPPLPAHYHGAGNRFDVVPNDLPHVHGPTANDIALRRYAFRAYPHARWIFYVGRHPHPGESPEIVGPHGPQDADVALKRGCPDTVKTISPSGKKWCSSSPSVQVPVPKSSGR
jgi:hypothetical protein